MIKRHELSSSRSCLNKADSEEPLFVLRAKDPMAPMAIRHWVTMSLTNHSNEKIVEAIDLAEQMEKWYQQNVPQVAAMP